MVMLPNHSVHVLSVQISSTVPPVSLPSIHDIHTVYTLPKLICSSLTALAHHLKIHFRFHMRNSGTYIGLEVSINPADTTMQRTQSSIKVFSSLYHCCAKSIVEALG